MDFPRLGTGVGLRRKHYPELFAEGSTLGERVDWFEVISENFMVPGGKPLEILERVKETHPIVMHGVSMSIGSADPLNDRYLDELARLVARWEPAIVSDHLCWGSIDGRYAHDLLPLPYAEEEIERIAERVKRVQDALGRRMLLENVSSYLTWKHSTMPEWEFLARLAEKADCGILLDVNNVYVSSRNHRFDPKVYLDAIPADRVGQFHLAGHSDYGSHVIDTHDARVIDPVWELYRHAVKRFGPVATLIEWDDKIPSFPELADEADRARKIAAEVTAREDAAKARHEPRARSPITAQETQRVLWDLITAPEGAAKAKAAPKIERFIVGDELSALFRADLYANMYFARLRDCLLEDYPALSAAAGKVGFHNLVTDFLLEHPSRAPSLRFLGAPLPGFLRTHALSKDLPWLADLAALEWARVEAFDAPDASPIALETLAATPPEKWAGLTFRFHPSLHVVPASWRVDHPWRQVDAEETPDPPEPATPGGALRVWRENTVVFHAWMEPEEAAALASLRDGATFGALCSDLAAGGDPEAAAQKAFRLLTTWLNDHLIT